MRVREREGGRGVGGTGKRRESAKREKKEEEELRVSAIRPPQALPCIIHSHSVSACAGSLYIIKRVWTLVDVGR